MSHDLNSLSKVSEKRPRAVTGQELFELRAIFDSGAPEARRRWGRKAFLEAKYNIEASEIECSVGQYRGEDLLILGTGKNFEEAFAAADEIEGIIR